MKKILSLALLIAFAAPAFASDIIAPQSTLYPFRSTVELQDDFISGIAASGTLGSLGWALAGGASGATNSIANRPGIYTRDTTAVISTIARTFLAQVSQAIDPAPPHSLVHIIRLNNNDANTTMRAGIGNSFTNSPPAEGIYIEKLDADTNWFCVTRAGGVQTRVDSTVAVTTVFNVFAYTRNSSGVQFSINYVNVCGLMTTNIPTAMVNPGHHIVNSAAASKTMDIDYFQLKIQGLTR